jgi:hypothetical protein
MSLNWPNPGLGHAPSYQVSSQPFLTSSIIAPVSTSEPVKISFSAVTRFVVIIMEKVFGRNLGLLNYIC